MLERGFSGVMVALGAAGTAGAVWLVLGVAAVLRRHARAAGVWQMALALALTSILGNGIIKPLVHRPRPAPAAASQALTSERPTTWSFPSGHAASSAAAAYSLGRVWPAASIPLWALAGAISFSRWYLGLHYATDVLAGVVLGIAVAWFVVGGTRWTLAPPDQKRTTAPIAR
jgi:undecaprenyl-diphosphatase